MDVGDFIQQALVEAGYLNSEKLAQVRAHAAEEGIGFEQAAVALGLVTATKLAVVKAGVHEVPYVNLANYEINFSNANLVPKSVAERFLLFPLFHLDGVLVVGMDDPLNLAAQDQVRQHARCEVEAVLCEPEQLKALINRAYRLCVGAAEERPQVESRETTSEEESQPVIAAVNQLLADAVDQGASDVHINPDEHELHLRFRIDGTLQTRQGPSKAMHAALVQRLKVMARLDLTQTRRPQDGKLRFTHNSTDYDVRLSTVPTVHGENVVMRILRPHAAITSFDELGLSQRQTEEIEDWIRQPYGMLLVTGPTGSGKTTTLYTALHMLNEPNRNVMTVEDPVEIRLPLVRQIQVNPEINLTFASALRSILRQDPDVVLVGEIRDAETASIAMQASLTGHLVLSTLHTNDSPGAVTRLQDLGVPPYLVNASLVGVVSQRLVRRVCSHCAAPALPDDLLRKRFQLSGGEGGFVQGTGCARCLHTGYRGRLGLYELLSVTPAIKAVIEMQQGTEPLREAALRAGMRPMWRDGVDKASLGFTTLAEVAKVAFVEHRDADPQEIAQPLLKKTA